MKMDRSDAERTAETYYDSTDADQFYEQIWGGDDIHIGLYEPKDISIHDASRATVRRMASMVNLGRQSRVIDLGAGYGGSARHLAREFDCHVSCLNLSSRQNARNETITVDAGLTDLVDVVHGSFEDIPCADKHHDIVWSQDAFLHSGQRSVVLDEITRVLATGGELIFTDPMQADDCPPGVLQPVYDRLELDSLASVAWYREELARRGFVELHYVPLVSQLRNHYERVATELATRQGELLQTISNEYLSRMLVGLNNWVDAADKGYLAWGILHFKKNT
jgi:cyclopropane fatty-acyl-phospholipid synthase-like methyltransferase